MLRITQSLNITILSAAIALLCALPAAYGQTAPAPAQAQHAKPAMSMKQALPQGKVTRLDNHARICMITNRAYAKDLPYVVKVDGKIYYGCCDMCRSMLQDDASKRLAVDPVSGKKADKSQAVIGVAANGGVVYFQSEADLEAYNRKFGGK